METTRRGFFKKSGILIASALLGPKLLRGEPDASPSDQRKSDSTLRTIEKRVLGRTGIGIAVMSVGTGKTNANAVRYAIDQGINFIHTAPDYDGGRSIQEVGKAIKGKTDKVYLGLKVTWNWNSDSELDRALQILGRDYVDILFFNIHNAPERVASPQAKASFERWKKQGKVRFMGLTTHGGMKACMESALRTGWYDCLMPSYKLSMRSDYLGIFEKCEKQNVGIVAIKTKIREGNTDAVPVMLGDKALTTICKTMSSLSAVKEYIESTKRKVSGKESQEIIKLATVTELGRCTMCGMCTLACSNGLATGDIVRSVDYYVDSMKNFSTGKEVYREIDSDKNAENCLDCGRCEKACPTHVPVRHFIKRSREMFC